MNKQTFKTACKILFLLDSISIATCVICMACDMYSEQRKLIGMLLPWLILLWIFLYNKAFGGVSRSIRRMFGRDY